MNSSGIPNSLQPFFKALQDNRIMWVLPTVIFGALGLCHALTKQNKWQASQAMIVRDEAIGELRHQGRFDSSDAMKAAQETILEVSKHRTVIQRALTTIRPAQEATLFRAKWPKESDIARVKRSITVNAPKGAEFGRTEVIYLSVTDRTPEKAVELNRAICEQLDIRLRELRSHKAQSMIVELKEKLKVAEADMEVATNNLEVMEKEIGGDLGELRNLNDSSAGDSNLRRALNDIKNEVRRAEAQQASLNEQLSILLTASKDPDTLFAMPNQLLQSQPALRRLKDGLVDAQLRTADLMGRMSKDHPGVRAAIAAEAKVRGDLYAELKTAVRAARAELKVNQALVQSHRAQLTDVQSRLDNLAAVRARYANLVADVRHRSEQVKEARIALAGARGTEEASGTASLLTRVDEPHADDSPLGPGRSTIVAGSIVFGFITGLGLVLLFTPGLLSDRRRWGRRAADQAQLQASGKNFGRRSNDAVPDQAPESRMRRKTDKQPITRGLRLVPTELPKASEPKSTEETTANPRPGNSESVRNPAASAND